MYWPPLSPEHLAQLGQPGKLVSPPVEVIDMRDMPRISQKHPWLQGVDPYEEGNRCWLPGPPAPSVYPQSEGPGAYLFHAWGPRFVSIRFTEEERQWVLDRDDSGLATTVDDLAAFKREALCAIS